MLARNGVPAGVSALLLAVLVACAAPSAAPGQAPPRAPAAAADPATAHPPALQTLIDAARQEGAIELVWGEGSVGGREGTRRLVDGINREYGLNLDVRFTPGPSFPEMVARLT